MGDIGFDRLALKKIVRWEGRPPHVPLLWETLNSNVEVAAPLKHLISFPRTLGMSQINS